MTTEGRNGDGFCYRHPDRESYVLCQRCGKTVCGQCQVSAAVGVHCPECAGGNKALGKPAKLLGARAPRGGGERFQPRATYVLLGIIVSVYVAQFLSGGALTQWAAYWPPLTVLEPWRMMTAVFVHSDSSIFHVLFNGYSLYILGTLLERLIGPGRFVALFLLSGFGGSLAVLWLAPSTAVVGASGAIFGLFGALFVIQRSFGGANRQLVIVLALNLAMGFIVPGISWQAHVGGVVTGALVAWILVRTRQGDRSRARRTQLVLVGAGLVAATVLGVLL